MLKPLNKVIVDIDKLIEDVRNLAVEHPETTYPYVCNIDTKYKQECYYTQGQAGSKPWHCKM